MQFTISLDLSTLKPHQNEALTALIKSLKEPYVIPTYDHETLGEYTNELLDKYFGALIEQP